MRTTKQGSIGTSQFSLPIICIIAMAIWLIIPGDDYELWNVADNGLWPLIPHDFQIGMTGQIVGLLLSAATTYAMVEFSNSMVLLRTSSRMLSCMLVFMLALTICIHRFQPGHVIMLAAMLSYFSMFASYQRNSPSLVFTSYFFFAIATLFCPKMIVLMPFLWATQATVQSFTPRCFFASLFALAVPYWFFFALTVFFRHFELFTDFFKSAVIFHTPDYSLISMKQLMPAGLAVVLFLSGAVDYFITNSINDKRKQRIIYSAIIINGLLVAALAVLLPQCFDTFLMLFLIDAAIVAGRFWVVTDNKFTHIYFAVLSIIAFLILALTLNM